MKSVELFVADGLTRLREAVEMEFPRSRFQLCMLHTVRSCMKKVRKADREAVAEDMRKIYKAKTREKVRKVLKIFKAKWRKYPEVVKKWEESFNILSTFMECPEEIRSYLYTTNMLERLMKEIKRRVKVIEVFSTPESAYKVIYLVLIDINESYKKIRLIGFSQLQQFEN